MLAMLWIGHWVVLCIITHAPVQISTPVVRRGEDKLVHFLLYFFLTLLGGLRVLRQGQQMFPGRLLFWATFYLCFAVVDEWTQQFVRRSPSLYDWMADAIGVILATWFLAARWRRTEKYSVSAVLVNFEQSRAREEAE